MKPTVLFTAFLLITLLNTPALSQTESGSGGNVSSEAENEQPEFPGGVIEMMNYVKANLKYPQKALDAKISGKCQLKFTIEADGSLTDISILEGMPNCPECEAEAVRVVKSMPKWKPGKLAGKPVALYYNLPVRFSLPKK